MQVVHANCALANHEVLLRCLPAAVILRPMYQAGVTHVVDALYRDCSEGASYRWLPDPAGTSCHLTQALRFPERIDHMAWLGPATKSIKLETILPAEAEVESGEKPTLRDLAAPTHREEQRSVRIPSIPAPAHNNRCFGTRR